MDQFQLLRVKIAVLLAVTMIFITLSHFTIVLEQSMRDRLMLTSLFNVIALFCRSEWHTRQFQIAWVSGNIAIWTLSWSTPDYSLLA